MGTQQHEHGSDPQGGAQRPPRAARAVWQKFGLLKHLTVRMKLIGSFVLVNVVFLSVLAVTVVNFNRSVDTNRLTSQSYEMLGLGEGMLLGLLNIETGQRGYLITGDSAFLEPLQIGKGQFEEAAARARTLGEGNPKVQELLSKVTEKYAAWLEKAVQPEIAVRMNLGEDASDLREVIELTRQANGRAYMEEMRTLIDLLHDEESGLLETRSSSLSRMQASTLVIILIGGAIAISLGLLMAVLLTRHLSRQLGGEPAYAVEVAHEIAKGNLDVQVKLRKNDRDSLLCAMQDMRGQLVAMIGAIQANAQNVRSSAGDLSSSSSQLSSSSIHQSAAVSSMSASVEELTVSVSHVSDSAEDVLAMARSSGETSQRGGEVIQRAVNEIEHIAEQVESSAASIHALEQHSQQISTVVRVIKEVADQTNLLALNAAIEAARAGETGRGFAVVADEVRKLAERTTSSTDEIAGMVSTIQNSTRDAIQQMERVVDSVRQGQSLASEAGVHIGEIQTRVAQVMHAVDEISAALREQNAASQSIATDVESVAQMTDENSSSAQSTAHSAEQLEKLADDALAIVERFRL
ncbi:MAG: methyl-accepting chemotaxis protein [Rhodocyclaceae bacterium]